MGFEDVVEAIMQNQLIQIDDHSNQVKYSKQKVLLVKMDNYVRKIPCRITEN